MNIRLALALALLLPATAPAFAQHAAHGSASAARALTADIRLAEDDFDALDADKDGFVAKSELPKGHPLAAHFSMADRSRDGKLDRREFKMLVGMQ